MSVIKQYEYKTYTEIRDQPSDIRDFFPLIHFFRFTMPVKYLFLPRLMTNNASGYSHQYWFYEQLSRVRII